MSKVWLNHGEVVGHLGHDAELRYTGNQTPVMTFSLASTKPADPAKNRPEETTWINCVLWGKLAEAIKAHMKKGVQVFFSGQMTIRKWQGRDGTNHQGFELVNWNRFAHQIIILNPARQGVENGGKTGVNPGTPGKPGTREYDSNPPGRPGGPPESAPGSNQAPPPSDPGMPPEADDPDLPF